MVMMIDDDNVDIHRFCYEWLQHLRHRVVGSGRAAAVEVAAGVETLDYGYEYVGVAAPPTLTPTSLRARHALLTAAATHRCTYFQNTLIITSQTLNRVLKIM